MPRSHRSSALVLSAAVIVAGACAHENEKSTPPNPRTIDYLECPGFRVKTDTISAGTGNDWDFEIHAGHRIDFIAGAVEPGSRYIIGPGPNAPPHGTRAEIRITPIPPAPRVFQQPVYLTLNTASCAGLTEAPITVIMQEPGEAEKSIGGWGPSTPDGPPYITVLIPHLTTFALAR